MTDNPMRYEWTGSTALEADNLLQAANDLIDAHLRALAPGDATVRYRLKRNAKVGIKVQLDLTELAATANEVQALNAAMNLDNDS